MQTDRAVGEILIMEPKAKRGTMLVDIFRKIAPRIGATVAVDPEWGIAGQITYPSGRRRYFRFTSLDINTLGASSIAKDKDFAQHFMAKMGYPVVEGQTFFSDDWAARVNSPRNAQAAYEYAKALGFPVVVKPNSFSRGREVSFVHTKRDLLAALRRIFRIDPVALVQRPMSGKDYRVVVLDDRVISAYERVPLGVTGDGRSTIEQLLAKKQRQFAAAERDTVIALKDRRIAVKLKRAGLSLRSVLPRGKRVALLDNANLSSGGDSVDVTSRVHPEFRDLAIRVTRDMGLRFCGVDLIVAGDIADAPERFWVLEVNSAPGLDNYAQTGKKQRAIVEDLYLEVLKHMEL